jgi:hypothetical protein
VENNGVPKSEICLTSAEKHLHKTLASLLKRAARKLVPDVIIQVKSLEKDAKLHGMLDMQTYTVELYFIEKPRVEWDLEFVVSGIPHIGDDDALDSVLTNVRVSMNKERPIQISF